MDTEAKRQELYALRGIAKRYGDKVVLRVEDLSLHGGCVYGIVGPNGAGKTTLLEILAFLEPPSEGRLRYRGELVRGTPGERRREVTMVLQNPVMFSGTVLDNVSFGLRARGLRRQDERRVALEALQAVQLDGMAGRRAVTLSGGEIQRVALARALAVRPRVLLLDEPLANVDAESGRLIQSVLRERGRDPAGLIIFSSHEPGLAYGLADELLTIVQGSLIPGGTENIFSGLLEGEGEEKTFLPLGAQPVREAATGGVEPPAARPAIRIVTDRAGPARVLIPPEAVILSTEPFASSARNMLPGKIVGIHEEGDVLRVTVDIGLPIVVRITHASRERLGLHPGVRVYASFKATALQVF